MPIPIRNIYYLLAYAWDGLDQAGYVDVGSLDGHNAADLLAHILIGGATHVLKRGLDRSYVESGEELSALRGRIDFGESLARQSPARRKLSCVYEELSADILHNQILKSSLARLARVDELDGDLRQRLVSLRERYVGVREIPLSRALFRKLQLNKNNAHYSILMRVCELVYDHALPDERGRGGQFVDFFQDERMPLLFQRFVLNFYRRECPDLRVGGEVIDWDAKADSDQDRALLPRMVTDITLRSDDRTWVIDTKYYEEALKGRFDAQKLISSNLYQIFSYLKNLEKNGGQDAVAEGILLYPSVGAELRTGYSIQGHRVRVCTVNLDNDWKAIRGELLGLIRATAAAGSIQQLA
ncbi:MAG: 5-methylcytosine-specific restriction endonuclease system specificity protein McrC [Elusimicrobiota bacterium]|nr:5-methylcytosine-specific restriction endonuclease system specificity protein McrC [Elusimicrobiota bacterium]